MQNLKVYTDGACSGNPGAGGWSAIIFKNGGIEKISGGEACTTNNRMELSAVINALACIKSPSFVTVFSDSAYVINAFAQGWLRNWINNGWRTRSNKSVLNKDLWLRLIELTNFYNVCFTKVKGHSNDMYNNECDELAKREIRNINEGNSYGD